MAKNLVLGLILALFTQISPPHSPPPPPKKKKKLSILPLLDVTHCWKLSLYAMPKKTRESNLRKWQKNLSFGPDFGPFGPNFDPKTFFVDFTSTRCYTLLQVITVCNFKEN